MKKSHALTTPWVALLLIASSTLAKPAHALVGLFSLSTGWMAVGAAMYLVDAIMPTTLYSRGSMVSNSMIGTLGFLWFDESAQEIRFRELTDSDRAQFGLTTIEFESYNREADVLGLHAQEIAAHLESLPRDQREAAARSAWLKLLDDGEVSRESITALSKLRPRN